MEEEEWLSIGGDARRSSIDEVFPKGSGSFPKGSKEFTGTETEALGEIGNKL